MEQQHELQLRDCLAAITKLTHSNAKLHAKLKRVKLRVETPQRKTAQLPRQLLGQGARSPRRKSEQLPSARVAATQDELAGDDVVTLRRQLEALTTQLTSREHENLALLQSLSERTEQHERAVAELTQQLATAREEHRKQVHEMEVEHGAKLSSYMDQVNAKLQRLEADNKALQQAKQRLETDAGALQHAAQQQQQQLQPSTPQRRVVTVSDKASETDAALVRERDQAAQQDLVTRVRLLELQLTQEQRANEALRDASRKAESQQSHEATQAVEVKLREVEARHAQLVRAFRDFQTASADAARASEKRIAFLTTCVDEASALVDSPSSEGITLQDVHDLIVALSRDVAVAPEHQSQHFAADLRLESPTSHFANTRGFDKLLLSDDDAQQQQWSVRAATLEQQVRAARLTNETLDDQLRRSESERSDLRDEVRDRMARELSLATKASGLKQELVKLKTHVAALATRYDDVRNALQQQIDECHAATQEVSRVRAALQRKSELLRQNKARAAELTRELQSATQRADALASAEKKALQQQQRAREQVQSLQDAKRQLEASQAHEYALTVALEREKEQSRSVQMRVKALRAENATLRTHMSDLKQQQLERLGSARASASVEPSGSQTMRQRQSDEPKPFAGPQDVTKMLRKRVLQKQQLVLAHRAKATEQEREIAQLHTKVLAAAQLNRELQLDLSTQKENALRHVAAMRAEMRDAVAQRAAHLDGLRASVYDSLEWDGNALLAMRRWTDLSVSDLDALHKHSPDERRRTALEDQKYGKHLLSSVEHALEQRPEDCRSEICEVLEFLCKRERTRLAASSY